ncbi:MAG TPA: hypothetical protein H9739_07345 [Candidatus Agathobaculum pullistercoris]|nr:DUF6773 family protein [uncultured Agathobaculum sp.]HIX11380.1 hypothetical protein [Candidatus Agathobaculum pullistercoris]
MKLFYKAKDERVVAEINRIYKIGFHLLSFGILADILLQAIGVRLEGSTVVDSSINLIEFAVLMLAWAVSLFLMSRKGLMDDNAFAEADRYPWKHYLVQGLLAGAGAAAVVCIIQFFSGAAWASMSVPYILLAFASQLIFMVPAVTILLLLITWVSFRYARERRRKTEQAIGDDEE